MPSPQPLGIPHLEHCYKWTFRNQCWDTVHLKLSGKGILQEPQDKPRQRELKFYTYLIPASLCSHLSGCTGLWPWRPFVKSQKTILDLGTLGQRNRCSMIEISPSREQLAWANSCLWKGKHVPVYATTVYRIVYNTVYCRKWKPFFFPNGCYLIWWFWCRVRRDIRLVVGFNKNHKVWGWKMVPWVGAFDDLAEEPGSVPSIHIRWLTNACNSSARGSDILSWLPQAPTCTWCMHTHTHMYT